MQEASLTGESASVLKTAAALPGPVSLGDRLCMVFKGTAVAQGSGRAVVTATGMHTEIGSIARMLEATREEPTPLQQEVARIGQMLGVAVVKNLSSVETLGCATVICSDKTGTLTRSEMTIERVVTASGDSRVTGVGYAPQGQVEHQGRPLVAGPLFDEHVVLLSGGSLAGNASLRRAESGVWEIQGDRTEAASLVAERKLGVEVR